MPFRDITGHRTLVTLLSRSIANGRLPPSLIFSGPAGVGKRLAALSMAQALNCLDPVSRELADRGGEPGIDACGTCAACQRIARGVHPDVLVVEPNDKGNIKIDPIRDLIERAGYRPFEGRRRVSIVDQADGLELSAQNALLKVLEEPPSGSVFVLVTSMPDLLLPTVRSRCPQLRFAPLSATEVAAVLTARGQSQAQALTAASLAGGSVGRALAAGTDALSDVRTVVVRILEQAARSDDVRLRMESARELVVKGTGPLSTEREQLAAHLRVMSSLLRDVAVMATSADQSILANPDLSPALERLSAFAGERGRQAFQAVDRALGALERYTNAKLVADWLILQL